MRWFFHILRTYIRSFFSPKLYNEIIYEKNDAGFSYLFALSIVFNIIIAIFIIIGSAAAVSYMMSLFGLPPMYNIAATLAMSISLGWRMVIAVAIGCISAFMSALIIYITAHILLLVTKPISWLTLSNFDARTLVRLTCYLHWPSFIVFYAVLLWGMHDGFIDMSLITSYVGLPMVYAMQIPWTPAVIIAHIIIFTMIPLPIWLLYTIIAMIASKFYFPKDGFVRRLDGSKMEILSADVVRNKKNKRKKKKS